MEKQKADLLVIGNLIVKECKRGGGKILYLLRNKRKL
nr:MAG TPA: hypothetical protein [Caudoviricetes sp.]